MGRPPHPLPLSVAAWLLAVALAAPAQGRAEGDSAYTLVQTYSSTLRFLRIDLGYEVTEKDPDAAYFLFRYRVPDDPKRVVDGSIELVPLENHVRILVNLPKMPVHHERWLRDGLLKKLLDDYGEPVASKPSKPTPPTETKPKRPPAEAKAPGAAPGR